MKIQGFAAQCCPSVDGKRGTDQGTSFGRLRLEWQGLDICGTPLAHSHTQAVQGLVENNFTAKQRILTVLYSLAFADVATHRGSWHLFMGGGFRS